MKKHLIIALALVIFSAVTASADSYTYKKGYRGNVGIGVSNLAGENLFEGRAVLETNHGYSFGNGFYVGGGIAFHVHADNPYGLMPVYAQGRFNFPNFLVSPFIDARIGISPLVNTDTNTVFTGFFFSPTIGVDIWRFSVALAYEINAYSKTYATSSINLLKLGLYFNW